MKLAIIFFLVFLGICAQSQSPSKPTDEDLNPKNEKGKPWESWDKYRKQMIEISEQLGVTCTYCHQPRNYRDSSKREFQIAKKHMEMVELLKSQFKDSMNSKVDCYLCHKGQAKIQK